ncbi:hypothetical protein HYW20_03420 [Candidatus Woesearchaeota archaeon]|nr:hypothetical protein [Candidatus Woesearchaeota archaeon]
MELEEIIPGKTYDFGNNLNNGVGLFFDSLIRYATLKTCEICDLKSEDDFESAFNSAIDKGMATQFMKIYRSILKAESDRSKLAQQVLLAAKMMQIESPNLEYMTSQSIN